MKIKNLAIIVAVCLVFVTPTQALEERFPTRPITVFIGTSPGGGHDVTFRATIPAAEKILGQPIVPENKPTGVGVLAMELLKNAKPDGYTLACVAHGSVIIVPHTLDVKYDPLNDFTYLLSLGEQTNGVVVKSDSPFKTFQDLIDFARKNPGKLTHGCPCVGCTNDVPIERIAQIEKVKLQQVYFKGSVPTTSAILGGHVMCGSIVSQAFLPHVKAGTMRLLALYDEMKEFPDVPSFKKLGYDFNVPLGIMHLVSAPKGLPKSIAEKLVFAFSEATKSAEFQNVASSIGQIFYLKSGDDLYRLIESQFNFYKPLIKEMGLGKK